MTSHIAHTIIKKITGYNAWAMGWKQYHMAKSEGIYGLSGKEEVEAIESLRPDYQCTETIH